MRRPVGTPDSVQVLAALQGGARATYQASGVTPFGQDMSITLFGTDGLLRYDLSSDVILGTSRTLGHSPGGMGVLVEIPIPAEKARTWTVEADFVNAIRTGSPVRFTDFETGVAYMEFTEAVARSARLGVAVSLPLEIED
jgi:predicted dehydrogenase